MQIDLSHADLKVLKVLLDRAGNEFGRHGCNDFDLVRDGGLTPEEVSPFCAQMKEAYAGTGDADEIRVKDNQMDWFLFAYFERRFTALLGQ